MNGKNLVAAGAVAFALTAGVGVTGVEAAPIVFTGCLAGPAVQTACSDGDLVTTPNDWTDSILRWTVTGDTGGGAWLYSYSLSFTDTAGPGAGPVDDVIIELSSSFTANDAISVSANCTVGTFNPSPGSNPHPNLPESIYGLKCSPSADLNPYTWTISTLRAPVWGDFYAKTGGNANNWGTAYNAGFLNADPVAAAGNGSAADHILRPDTIVRQSPEPAVLLMFGLALGLVARTVRRTAA